ncbi:MAG TPA: hypothetical protein VF772_08865, partial [Terriglobales bacterium]
EVSRGHITHASEEGPSVRVNSRASNSRGRCAIQSASWLSFTGSEDGEAETEIGRGEAPAPNDDLKLTALMAQLMEPPDADPHVLVV